MERSRQEIEVLYAKHAAMVLRRAKAILGEEQAARDAMQEVFIRALREWASFRHDASPVTWLYRITTNLCLNRLRDESRRREIADARAPLEKTRTDSSAETEATLADILRRVPEELREIAVHYWVDEMSQDEIAAMLGVARRTVGYRLEAFRAAALAVAGEAPRAKGEAT